MKFITVVPAETKHPGLLHGGLISYGTSTRSTVVVCKGRSLKTRLSGVAHQLDLYLSGQRACTYISTLCGGT